MQFDSYGVNYLNSQTLGDEEEVRRLFRFLRGEHVGVHQAEFYLHQACFELTSGKPEKCLSILEAACKIPSVINGELLKRALVEFRLLGSFRVEPLVGGDVARFAAPMTPMSNGPVKGEFCVGGTGTVTMPFYSSAADNSVQLTIHNSVQPTIHTSVPPTIHNSVPPTPSRQLSRDDVKMTPLPISNHDRSRHHLSLENPSNPTLSMARPVSDEIRSSALTSRVRRLGNLGPPKRAIMNPISLTPSPQDKTTPQTPSREVLAKGADPMDVEIPDAPMNSAAPSIINSPSRTTTAFKMDDLILDKESNNNMSLTTISPNSMTGRTRDRASNAKVPSPTEPTDDTTTLRSRAVRVNGKSYKVLQLIGRGGSSKVFKVLAPDMSILALKKVGLRNLDESTLSGYLNEIDLLLSFKESLHIIKLIDYEINKEHGNLYMVMEFGEADLGRLLRDALKRSARPNINFIRFMWEQMLQAVQTVHAAKIVHCDLKPANFLLVGGVLKLIDFGISKAIMNDTTNIVRENQVGTVNYMSPEALQESSAAEHRGRIKIGRASDVWSLGCILYEMVYGKPPFAKYTLIQRLHKILDHSYDIEYEAVDDPSLLEVIKACLQRAAKRRPFLDELLAHPFLVPHPLTTLIDETTVSKKQINDLLVKFAKHIPNLDAVGLADKIFLQWQRQRFSGP